MYGNPADYGSKKKGCVRKVRGTDWPPGLNGKVIVTCDSMITDWVQNALDDTGDSGWKGDDYLNEHPDWPNCESDPRGGK